MFPGMLGDFKTKECKLILEGYELNSAKFTPDGSKAWIEQSTCCDRWGIGVYAFFLKQIFLAFHRLCYDFVILSSYFVRSPKLL